MKEFVTGAWMSIYLWKQGILLTNNFYFKK